jgi:predicted phosphohydrolase
MTIIPVDSRVTIDGVSIGDLDLSWIPENIHAVQWYDTYGEVELVTSDPNIDITELGIYEQAIPLWESKKLELEELQRERLEQERLMEEEQQKQLIMQQYQMASQGSSDEISEILSNNEVSQAP